MLYLENKGLFDFSIINVCHSLDVCSFHFSFLEMINTDNEETILNSFHQGSSSSELLGLNLMGHF